MAINRHSLALLAISLFALASCGGLASSSSYSSSTESSAESSSSLYCEPESDGGTSLPAQTSKDVTYPAELPAASENAVAIHYRRSDAKYSIWGLWLWAKGSDGAVYEFNYQDDFGVIAYYPLSEFGANTLQNSLGFIIRHKAADDWTKDVDSDRFIDFSALTAQDKIYHVYLLSGDSAIYTTPTLAKNDLITTARFASARSVEWAANKKVSSYVLYEGGSPIAEGSVCGVEGTVALPHDADVTKAYRLDLTFLTSGATLSSSISSSALYRVTSFDEDYYYSGDDLGAVYSSSGTTFKVWSPVSSEITLNLYDDGSPDREATPYRTLPMAKGDKGVFAVSVDGDLAGKYYTYSVTNSFYADKEIVDPYAKGCGLNGVRGMIVDFSKTNPVGWDEVEPLPYDRKELTIWETHVADVTSSATWTGTEANRKKYLGLAEAGTTYYSKTYGKTVSTGFDHIKELGVNAVQLMPIFDQANDELNPAFNWGYNPLNYNCLEGIYSSDPRDGYARIREFKEVVKAYAENGINIIMDVVYNHVAGLDGSNFDVLMPGYYFRYDASGAPSNGSGCGNETASEMRMFRKFMIDSTGFWAKEYKLGGFRFDLMGLHDLETMKEVVANLKTINPHIFVHGEPWTGGTTTLESSQQAKQANGNSFVGYGAFNDGMRDGLIKGGLHAASEQGWVTDPSSVSASDVNTIVAGLKGTTLNGSVTIADPDKTTNYVTCHDNYTLRDRLLASGGVGSSGETLAKAGVLANSFTFLSQGTSFMLSGDEFSRTKGGNSNSYNASYSVNELNYELKARFFGYVEYYEKLIALKKTVDGLHLGAGAASSLNIETLAGGAIIKQTFSDVAGGKSYVAYHCNGNPSVVSSSLDLTGYDLYLDSLGNARSGVFAPAKYEVIIGVRAA